jgi:hypothetical protein
MNNQKANKVIKFKLVSKETEKMLRSMTIDLKMVNV